MQIAMQQSAEDIGCNASDFLADDNRVVPFKLGEKSKNYYKLPIGCNFISYGNNVVAAATDEISGIAKEYVSKFKFYHCFETPNMRWLNERLEPLGMTACFMAEYYLPDLNILTELPCEYELRILEKGQFCIVRNGLTPFAVTENIWICLLSVHMITGSLSDLQDVLLMQKRCGR